MIINLSWAMPKMYTIGPAAVAGLFGLGGSVLSGLFGRSSASRQQRFQREMSNTAHQREVADLRSAGLNPILSATGGTGASSPGGAMPPTPDFASSAIAAKRLGQELNNLKATELKTYAEIDNIENKTDISGPMAEIAKALSVLITGKAPSSAKSITDFAGDIQWKRHKNSPKSADKPKRTKRGSKLGFKKVTTHKYPGGYN